MAVTLYLDVGNSRCKWRAVGKMRQQGSVSHEGHWQNMVDALPDVNPDCVVVSSVAGADYNRHLADAMKARWAIDPIFHVSPAQELGVINAYDKPASLGVDRWLGLVEAYLCHGACIVIDSGSAMTIDVVNRDGLHLGGYIVPGLKMMHQSLRRETADVHLQQAPDWHGLAPGTNTDEAVSRGILQMTVTMIEQSVVALAGQLDDTCTTVLTGGDATCLQPLLDITTCYHADLVLDGLERVTTSMSGE